MLSFACAFSKHPLDAYQVVPSRHLMAFLEFLGSILSNYISGEGMDNIQYYYP